MVCFVRVERSVQNKGTHHRRGYGRKVHMPAIKEIRGADSVLSHWKVHLKPIEGLGENYLTT
jgi:hypothetical protein